jgi:hypothetical protein
MMGWRCYLVLQDQGSVHVNGERATSVHTTALETSDISNLLSHECKV